MAVIFAPTRNPYVSGLSGLGRVISSTNQRYRVNRDRDRALKIQEERRKAEAEERRSRGEFREFQMERMRNQAARQERADVQADIDIQAGEAIDEAGVQKEEVARILESLAPSKVKGGGLVELGGGVIPGTERETELGVPKIGAPSMRDLLAQADDTEVTLPAVGPIPERTVSVRGRALGGLDRAESARRQKLEDIRLEAEAKRDPGSGFIVTTESMKDVDPDWQHAVRPGQWVSMSDWDRMVSDPKKAGGAAPVIKYRRNADGSETAMRWTGAGWTPETDLSRAPKVGAGGDGDDIAGNAWLKGANWSIADVADREGREMTPEESREFYLSLRPEIRGPAESVANYKLDPSKAGRGTEMRSAIIVAARRINPNYSQHGFDFMREWTKGKPAIARRAINDALADASQAFKLSGEFKRTGMPWLNRGWGWFLDKAGSPEEKALRTRIKALATEFSKAQNNGMAAKEVEVNEAYQRYATTSSPEELAAILRQDIQMTINRMATLENEYQNLTGERPKTPTINRQTLEAAKKHGFYDLFEAVGVSGAGVGHDPGGLGLNERGGGGSAPPPIF